MYGSRLVAGTTLNLPIKAQDCLLGSHAALFMDK
jgi:hypothetical protein